MPKQFLRRGLLTGAEKLSGQLRDAAQGGQRGETEADRAQGAAKTVAQRAAYQLGKLAQGKKKVQTGRLEIRTDTGKTRPDGPIPDNPMGLAKRSSSTKPVRAQAGDTPQQFLPTGYSRANVPKSELTKIEAKSNRAQYQAAARPSTPAQRRTGGNFQPRHISMRPAQNGKRSAGDAVRGTVSNGKRQIKELRSGTRSVGRTSRQAVKTADSSRKAIQAGSHSAQTTLQTARAVVHARQRAVQAASGARQAAAAVNRRAAKAAASALRRTVSAIRALLAPLVAGGGAVIAVVLVLCLTGALLTSPLGIFFSGEGGGVGTGQTMSSAVREINQEYHSRVEALETGTAHDALSLSGSRAAWPEVFAVYAVKTATDPTNGLDVLTMDDAKKELLKQVFWDMNELSSFTSTAPGEGEDETGTTTLHITVTAKTASEMADVYGFNLAQRRQLAGLLSDEYRGLWSAVLYGISTGDGEIVAVALSQVGNEGGQPYWSWYGFSSRVEWCACFVSWCANECGYIDTGVVPKFAGCVQGVQWFQARGLWQDKSYTPNPGDIVFFDWACFVP